MKHRSRSSDWRFLYSMAEKSVPCHQTLVRSYTAAIGTADRVHVMICHHCWTTAGKYLLQKGGKINLFQQSSDVSSTRFRLALDTQICVVYFE